MFDWPVHSISDCELCLDNGRGNVYRSNQPDSSGRDEGDSDGRQLESESVGGHPDDGQAVYDQRGLPAEPLNRLVNVNFITF